MISSRDLEVLSVRRYSVSLPFPQIVQGIKTEKKEGYYFKVKLKSSDHQFDIDLSPFPGFSNDNLEDLKEKVLDTILKGTLENEKNPHLEFLWFQCLAFIDPIKDDSPLFINKLVKAEQLKDILIENLEQKDCLKIKVQSKEDQKHLLTFLEKNQIIQNDEQTLKLRIDCNATLSPKELIKIYGDIKPLLNSKLILDYFEEPLSSFEQYKNLTDDTLPYAHEEHLKDFLASLPPEDHLPLGLKGVVIKPSQQGISVVSTLKSHSLRVIYSSAFEAPPSLNAIRKLALNGDQQAHNEFHGLGATVSEKDFSW